MHYGYVKRRATGILAGILVAAATYSGFCEESGQLAARDQEDAATARPNIVLFVIDTLRADRLGVYGYDKPTSPHIDALAKESVRFARADSPAPWTLPSIVSMMTSTYPIEHRVVASGQAVDPSLPVLASYLKGLGYTTTSFYANEFAGDSTGMTRGFDRAELVHHTGKSRMASFLEARSDSAPFFLYIHNVEPHNPFELRVSEQYIEPFGAVSYSNRLKMLDLYTEFRNTTKSAQRNREAGSEKQAALLEKLHAMKSSTIDTLYDASVRLADARVGEVIEALKRAGAWDNTLFILVSDHGEEMGEHGGWQHDQSVYPELVHVPFIMKFPGRLHAGQVRPEAVSLLDLMPTVLDVLGALPESETMRGTSLLPAILEAAPTPPKTQTRLTAQRINISKYYRPFKVQRGDINIVLHHGPWKAIWNVEHDSVELYNVTEDPANHKNVANGHPELVRMLRDAARERFGDVTLEDFKQTGERRPLAPDQRKNLEALGYL